ncbi:MAG TPA: acetate uptake transporter [Ktedonobacteraceae bacterium]|nr:acetate uptake transporter [Ktedonobacteraceae bacterium]
MMKDYNTTPATSTTPVTQETTTRVDTIVTNVASPAPLGLNVLAFATAIVGCFYTGFIIPYENAGMRPAVGVVLFILGVILVLAGMWEYRKNSMLMATLFTSYGGFLGAIGLIFIPNFGILAALNSTGDMHFALGLFFLCWTIFSGIVLIGTLRSNAALIASVALLFVSYLLLTIGQLASNSYGVVHAGGWVAIACAVVAWLAGLTSILAARAPYGIFRLPIDRRVAPIE